MRKLLSAAAAVILAASCCRDAASVLNRAEAIAAQINDPSSDYVVVISHRGDWRNWPENSLPAFESAIRMGVDMVELDLKMTRDSVLVLSHDATVLRCTNFRSVFKDQPDKSPKVSDLTYEEISRLSLLRMHAAAVIDTLRLPTLREALETCRNRVCVNVDQGYEYYDRVLAIAEELGVTGQILIKGKKSIDEVAAHEAGYEHNLMYMPIVDAKAERGRALLDSYLERGVVPLAYEVCWRTGDDDAFAEVCGKIREQGARIWVNTLWPSLCGGHGNDDDAAYLADDPDEVYGRYLDLGVSMIQSDRPEMLVKYLEGKGRHTLE